MHLIGHHHDYGHRRRFKAKRDNVKAIACTLKELEGVCILVTVNQVYHSLLKQALDSFLLDINGTKY